MKVNDPYKYIADLVIDKNSLILYGSYIVRVKIGNIISNELLLYDDESNGYIWLDDWYEGEKEVSFVGFIPVDCVPEADMIKKQEVKKWQRS